MPTTINLESNGQAGDYTVQDYYTYRTLTGQIDFRLTDVSISGGRRWADPARFYVHLVDANGVSLSGGQVLKYWGQDGQWFGLTPRFGYARRVRLRVQAQVITYSSQTDYNFCTWKGQLRHA